MSAQSYQYGRRYWESDEFLIFARDDSSNSVDQAQEDAMSVECKHKGLEWGTPKYYLTYKEPTTRKTKSKVQYYTVSGAKAFEILTGKVVDDPRRLYITWASLSYGRTFLEYLGPWNDGYEYVLPPQTPEPAPAAVDTRSVPFPACFD